MEFKFVSYSVFALTCGIISAKWALELGFNQFRQLLWGIGGVILGPIMLLILYVRLIYKSMGK